MRGCLKVFQRPRRSLLAWLASRCFNRFFIRFARLDICPPSVPLQTLGPVQPLDHCRPSVREYVASCWRFWSLFGAEGPN